MEIPNFITGILIFCCVIGVFALAIGDVNDNYNININETWANQYDKIDEINDQSVELQDTFTGNQSVSSDTGYISYFTGAFKSLLLVFEFIPLTFHMITSISSDFGIPPVIFWTISTIILISILFAIINSIRKA